MKLRSKIATGAAALVIGAGVATAAVTMTSTPSTPNLVGGTFAMTNTAVNMKTGKQVHLMRATTNRWCYGQAQINAWSGGPWVKSYNGCPGPSNGNFANITLTPTINHALQFKGGGAWNNRCIGDANNDSGDARTSLDSCGTNGVGEGWGVDMEVGSGGCPSGSYWFRDIHWSGATNGYLGPQDNWTNGSVMYLNKQVAICFKYYPAG